MYTQTHNTHVCVHVPILYACVWTHADVLSKVLNIRYRAHIGLVVFISDTEDRAIYRDMGSYRMSILDILYINILIA